MRCCLWARFLIRPDRILIMRTTTYICVLLLIVSSCCIERADEQLYSDTDYYHAIMRKHYEVQGCDLFFELDDGTIVVPYMLTVPMMMPDGQEVEISFTVMEDIDAGCEGGVTARITKLREVGCGPLIDLGLDWAANVVPADDFDIVSSEMVDDCLKLVVSYSGGCEIHEFLLYAEPLPAFDEIQGMLSLAHYGHGDLCKALVRDTVSFDLTSLQNRSANHSRLSLSTSGTKEMAVIYIDYYYK